jgi:hypothetical protein
MAVFWDVVPCGVVDIDRRFGGVYCLHQLTVQAVSSSEISVSVYHTTLRNIPEDSHVHETKPLV